VSRAGMLAMNKMVDQKRVYLVEDHPLMRESLATLLKQEMSLVICGESDSAKRAEREIPEMNADLAILDISLNGSSGFDLIKRLRAEVPRLKIIVLSMHDEKLYAERCIRAGANGYLMKREPSKRVLEAIRDVFAGNLAISGQVSNSLVERFIHAKKSQEGALLSELTDRELEVFNLLGQGLASRKIAENLNVSAKTVQVHFHRIKQKLHLSTATELLREATRWHHDSSAF
jgi:DNA-binding NarL/FixJ family response regulator